VFVSAVVKVCPSVVSADTGLAMELLNAIPAAMDRTVSVRNMISFSLFGCRYLIGG